MAISRIGVATALVQSGTNGNLTFTEPTGTAQDDYLVVWIGLRGSKGYQTPTGWTKLREDLSGNIDAALDTSIAGGQLFYIKRGAAAPTLTFTANSTGTGDLAMGRIITLRGVHPTNPIWDSEIAVAPSASLTAVTVNTHVLPKGCYAYMGLMGARSGGWSAQRHNSGPTSLTEMDEDSVTTGADGSCAHAEYLSTGTLAGATMQATHEASARHCICVAFFRPAPDQPPTLKRKHLAMNPGDANVASTISTGTFSDASWSYAATLCMTKRGSGAQSYNGVNMRIKADSGFTGVGYRIQISPEFIQLLTDEVASSDSFVTYIEVGRPFRLEATRGANGYITVSIDNQPILVHDDSASSFGAGYIGFLGDDCGIIIDEVSGPISENFDTVSSGAKVFDDVVGNIRIYSTGAGTAEVKTPKVRYIRDYCGISNINSTTAWSEINAIGTYSTVDEATAALGASVTLNFTPSNGTAGQVIDGTVGAMASEYVSTTHTGTPLYAQIDLGALKDISSVAVWHDYDSSRKFQDVKTQVSENGTDWLTLFDSERGSGNRYIETSAGKTHTVYDPGLFTLQDTFDDGTIGAAWTVDNSIGATVAETGGMLQITVPNPVAGGAGLVTASSTYSLIDKAAYVKMTPTPPGSGTDAKETDFYMLTSDNLHGTRWTRGYGAIIAQYRTAGTVVDVFSLASTDPWLRVREYAGTVYWDSAPATASNPPLETEWVNRASTATTNIGSANLQALKVMLMSGAWQSSDGGGTATFDGFTSVVNTASPVSVDVTGVSATASLGTTTQAGNAGHTATGFAATAAVGTTTQSGMATVPATGVSSTSSIGTAVANASAVVAVSGLSATAALGTASGAAVISAAVTGLSATAALGTVEARGSVMVEILGLSATGAVGNVTAAQPNEAVLSGVQASALLGTVEAGAGATIQLSGVTATGSIGNASSFVGTVVMVGVPAMTAQLGVPGFVGQRNVRANLEDFGLRGMTGELGNVGIRAWGLVNDSAPSGWTTIQTE